MGCLRWSQCRRGPASHLHHVTSRSLFQCRVMEASTESEKACILYLLMQTVPISLSLYLAGKLKLALRFRKALERDDDILKK